MASGAYTQTHTYPHESDFKKPGGLKTHRHTHKCAHTQVRMRTCTHTHTHSQRTCIHCQIHTHTIPAKKGGF